MLLCYLNVFLSSDLFSVIGNLKIIPCKIGESKKTVQLSVIFSTCIFLNVRTQSGCNNFANIINARGRICPDM